MTINEYLEKQFILQNINRFFNEILVEAKLKGYNDNLPQLDLLLKQKFDSCIFLNNNFKSFIEFDSCNNLVIAVYKKETIFLSLILNLNPYESKK